MLKKQERTSVSLLFFISVLLYLKYSRQSDISILTVLSKFLPIQNTKRRRNVGKRNHFAF
jgi:hypothetical protein